MHATLSLRIAASLIMLIGALVLPWWMAMALGAAFLFAFRTFFEFPFVFLALDLLYGGATHTAFGIPYFLSVASLALYALSIYLKRRLLLYQLSHA